MSRNTRVKECESTRVRIIRTLLLFYFCTFLLASAADAQIDYLASTNSATASAKVLLGRSAGAISGNVTLTLTNIPAYLVGAGTVHVLAERIPDNGTAAVASEMTVINADYTVSANSITVTLASMGATDGYVVTLTPGTGGSPPSALSTTETVTINMALDGGPVTYKASGFLHQGFTSASPSDAFVTPVKPRLVRCGEVATSFTSNICNDIYARATALGAKVQLLVSDNIYAAPWPGDGGNWTSWDNRCTSKANAAVSAGRTYQWDIWNEPNFATFWAASGGQSQFFETYRRCVNIIRSIIPGAVIVGPSAGPYDATWIQQFLTYAKANNVLPNILSWHEFDTTIARGSQIPTNIATMRNYMTANAMNVAQIQINEMILEDEYYSPGKTIRYLANIERTEAVGAVHACWADAGTNTGDNCFNSPGNLNGLLTTAGTAARGSWWAYKTYGDMTGRLVGFVGIIPTPTIARTGSCAAAGTSCTLSSVAAGDLVVTFAYRSGNVTAPGAAVNNTSIRTGQTSGGQNTASYRLSCRRASSSGDTGSGTFSSASGVVSVAYQGTNVNATADCQTSGIGARGATGNGVNWAKSSTTVSYQSLALTKIDGTAWVVGFMGGSASATCSPGSLTNRASAGVVRASDSNATVTSFSTGTCGVSSETWMSETLEVLPLPAPPAGDTEAPSVPAGLNLATISSSQINASWSPSTDNVGVTEYRVERCTGAGCSNFIEVENPPSTAYNDTGLLASTSYSYRVRASDLVGNLSGYSTTATTTTSGVIVSSNQLGEAGQWWTLDDFTTQQKNGDGGNLFELYLGEDPNQTVLEYPGTANKIFRILGGTGDEIYWNFYPRSGGFIFPKGYLQNYITGAAPSNWANINRMQFLVRPSASHTRRADGGSISETGTYIRNHADSDAANQGDHYYHSVNPNWIANRWHLFIMNRTPNHKVGQLSSINWGDNPSMPTVSYYDGMTRWYFDNTHDNTGETWSFKGPEIGIVSGAEDAEVATIVAVYTGTRYEIAWNSIKGTLRFFDVRYSTSASMKANGFTSGTDGGTVSTPDTGYTGVFWASPNMSEANPGIWVAIRRQGATDFNELWLPYGMQPSTPPAAATNVVVSRRRIQ